MFHLSFGSEFPIVVIVCTEVRVMKKDFFDHRMIVQCFLITVVFLIISLLGNDAVKAFSENEPSRNTVIIDAGHGGIDGGAVSCTGVTESKINLDIDLKLEDLMHLLGIHTIMIRDTDRSVHTEGNTIATKKVSDIRNRVQAVNTTPNALLVSIHQNNFTDSRYFGAQVFYNQKSDSKVLADQIQTTFRSTIDAENRRKTKKAQGIYLMDHINCTGVLIECGFLSNPVEEMKLLDDTYQQKMCYAIACTISQYLNT